MIDSFVEFGIGRGTFELARRHFIVSGADRDAKLPNLLLKIDNIALHPAWDGSKIMVFKLLPFGRRCAKQSTAARNQIRAGMVKCLIDQKVFLLGTQGWMHTNNILIEVFTDGRCSLVNGSNGL